MDEKQPKVSIIIPAYNIEKHLHECLESVDRQTYFNIETIIINDGSKDRTNEIIDNWAEKKENVIAIHTENYGVSRARNRGLDEVTGDFIMFIDSDDYITEYHIEELVEIFLKEKPDLVASKYTRNPNELDHKSDYSYEIVTPQSFLENIFDNHTSTQTNISLWGKLYKRELFDNIRFPDELIYEDQAVNYAILSKINKIAISGSISYYYRDTDNSIMNESVNERFLDSLKISELIKESLNQSGKFSKDEITRYSNNVIFTQYIRTLWNEDSSKNWIGDQLFREYKKNIRKIKQKTSKEKLINFSLYSRKLFDYLLIGRECKIFCVNRKKEVPSVE